MIKLKAKNLITRCKGILPLLLFLFILTSIALADWETFQNDEANTGRYTTETGHFSEIDVTLQTSNGHNSQPLITNITGDADREIILMSGNFLQIYDDQLTLIDEVNTGEPLRGQLTLYDNGTDTIIIHPYFSGDNSAQGINITMYRYNSTPVFEELCSLGTFIGKSSGSDITNNAGITCNGDYCYYAESMTTSGNAYFVKVDMTNISGAVCGSQSLNLSVGGNRVLDQTPAIGDIDRDGRDEVIILVDDDADSNTGLFVIDANGTGAPYLDTGFSADGRLDDISTGVSISNPIVHNIDDGGDLEIILSFLNAGSQLSITTLKSDGSTFAGFPVGGYTATTSWQTVVTEFGGSNEVLCTMGGNSTTNNTLILCVEDDGDMIANETFSGYTSAGANRLPIIAVDLDQDSTTAEFDDILFPQGIIRSDFTVWVNTSLTANDYYIAVTDLDRDNEVEIIASKAGDTRVIYSDYVNLVPNLTNDVRVNTGNPICTGEQVTFSAIQDTDYTNDFSADTERLVLAFANGTNTTGSFSSTSPSVAHTFDVVGSFQMTIYLQDNANPNDISQFVTYTATVSANTQICNGAGEEGTDTGVAPSSSDIGDDVLESFGFSLGDGARLIVWLIIMIWVLFQLKEEQPLVLLGAGVLLIIAGVVLGMIPAWIPVILGMACAVVITLILFGNKGAGNGVV